MSKGYIICVDDEVAVLETLQSQLQNHFGQTHEVETSTSAKDALELIEEISSGGAVVELVITDQVMPDMKGDELLREIHDKHPEIIKILLTGQAGLDSAISAINTGGLSRYIEKPWNIEELSSDIEKLIQKFRQNLENVRIIKNLNRKIQQLEEENSNLRAFKM